MPNHASLIPLFLAPAEELTAAIEVLGGRAFHARIVRERVLGAGVLDYAAMTSLSASLREALAETLPILAGEEVRRSRSGDGVTKLLLGFPGPEGKRSMVETVHIPPHSRTSKKGATLCVSTQVGCPVACPFCASGRSGLERNLSAAEIVEQYLRGRALGELSRSVVMGIGEPLLNYRAVLAALRLVNSELGIGARKNTLSTIGYPEKVRRAARDDPPFQLAISLHTPFDDERDELVPAMRGTPVDEVLAAADDWFAVTGREVTYECVLLRERNDTPRHALELLRRLTGRRCTVNLIPFNRIGDSGFLPPSREAVEGFQRRLAEGGLVVTVRWSRGVESNAACGQLRSRESGG